MYTYALGVCEAAPRLSACNSQCQINIVAGGSLFWRLCGANVTRQMKLKCVTIDKKQGFTVFGPILIWLHFELLFGRLFSCHGLFASPWVSRGFLGGYLAGSRVLPSTPLAPVGGQGVSQGTFGYTFPQIL